ncbi:hypothetical protein [Archangium lipolyticum]|uniref:hypothetical protein n=1 Tax=Archangium lipolyticum TaxID=2970465 RepID=UPI00214A2553|nr:hypothetical protein [Archangium lipolyticum]
MKRLLLGGVVLLLCLSWACHARRTQPPATVRYIDLQCERCSLEELVRREAEPSAVDCGWARKREEWRAVSECVLKADAEGRPFRAIMWLPGIDSEITAGYIRKADGTRMELWSDSDGSGGGRSCAASVSRTSCARLLQNPKEPWLLTCDAPGERVSLCREGATRRVEIGPARDATDVSCDPKEFGDRDFYCERGEGPGNVPAGTSLVCLPGESGKSLTCAISSGEENPFPGLNPE